MSGSSRRRPADETARRRAATELGRNLVVLAGAGTGKTSLLVERLLTALGSGRLELGRVAAITFTEKAAAEMRQRLAGGLEALRLLGRGEAEPDPARSAGRAFLHLVGEVGAERVEIASRAVEALDALEASTVTTLHGFCSDLLKAYPFEADVDPHFTVDTGERFEALLDEEWERFLAEELGEGATREELWRSVLGSFTLEDVRLMARELAGFEVPERLLEDPSDGIAREELFAERGAALAAAVEEILGKQKGMTDKGLRFYRAMRRGLASLLAGGAAGVAGALEEDEDLAAVLEDRSPPGPGKRMEGVEDDEFRLVLRDGLGLLRSLAKVDDEALDEVVQAVAPFARRSRRRFLRRGYLSFEALLVLARDLLRDHPDIRRRLKRRYDALLVDEFQDTDPLQYEIVLLLGEEVEGEAREAFEARLAPGRLFVVGDPKQSIYRFRGADYQACLRAVSRVVKEGGEVLDLTANFRGRPGALLPVNRLFTGEGSSWSESDYQPPFVPIDPFREEAGEGTRVELWTVVPPEGGAEPRRLAEGRILGREIRRLAEEEGYGFGKISILLRSFTNLSLYLRGLREWGVPFVVDGGREFLERPEVEHLLAVLRALAHPADAVALLAYLRSPAGGVSDVELAGYAAADNRWDWRRPADREAFPRIAEATSLLRELERESRDLPADALVRRTLERTWLSVLEGAAFEGAQRVANLRKLAATAADLARDGSLSLAEVLDALEQGRGADLESNSPLADETTEAVRVVTVHKAKGLENEIILVPDLARGQGGGGQPPLMRLVRRADGSRALGLSLGGRLGSARVWIDEERKRHEEAEGVRVLYVALTRARERLVLLAGANERSPWMEALAPWGYEPGTPPGDGDRLAEGAVLHRLRTPPSRGAGTLESAAPETAAAEERFAEARERLAASPEAAFRPPSGLRERETAGREDREDETAPVPARAPEVARLTGVVVHRLLEIWDGDGEALRRSAASAGERTAVAEGLDEPAASELREEVASVIESFLSSELASRFRNLRGRGALLARELPILLRVEVEEGRTERFRGFVDLLYRDEEGGFVVADYKTDLDLTPEEAADHYRDQLAVYAESVMKGLSLDALPRTELWLLRTGETVTL